MKRKLEPRDTLLRLIAAAGTTGVHTAQVLALCQLNSRGLHYLVGRLRGEGHDIVSTRISPTDAVWTLGACQQASPRDTLMRRIAVTGPAGIGLAELSAGLTPTTAAAALRNIRREQLAWAVLGGRMRGEARYFRAQEWRNAHHDQLQAQAKLREAARAAPQPKASPKKAAPQAKPGRSHMARATLGDGPVTYLPDYRHTVAPTPPPRLAVQHVSHAIDPQQCRPWAATVAAQIAGTSPGPTPDPAA